MVITKYQLKMQKAGWKGDQPRRLWKVVITKAPDEDVERQAEG